MNHRSESALGSTDPGLGVIGGEMFADYLTPRQRQPALPRSIALAVVLVLSSTLHVVADDGPYLSKRRMVWGLGGAVGFVDGSRARHFESLSLVVSRVLTDPVGSGWLSGRIGMAIEMVPLFLLSADSTTYAAGFNLLGRYYFQHHGPVGPFLSLGAGMLGSAKEIPDHGANLNFTPQVGIGVLFADAAARTYALEFRVHHISNGGRVEPNPGLNSAVVLFAVSFPGRREVTP